MTESSSDDCDADLESMATSSTVSNYFQNGQLLKMDDFDEFDQIIANGSDQEESNSFFFNVREIPDDDREQNE